MMTQYEIDIAFKEGYNAYNSHSFYERIDNPYIGVSETLRKAWSDGWWKAFDEVNKE